MFMVNLEVKIAVYFWKSLGKTALPGSFEK